VKTFTHTFEHLVEVRDYKTGKTVLVNVTVAINSERIAAYTAAKAWNNKSKVSNAQHGAICVRAQRHESTR
jgi:RecB family exonuclease